MKSMSDKEMDDFFKASFKDFEKKPEPGTWQRISQQIKGKARERQALPSYLMVAASIAILAIVSVKLFNNEEETIRLRADVGDLDTLEVEDDVAAVTGSTVRPSDSLTFKSLEELRVDNEQRFLASIASYSNTTKKIERSESVNLALQPNNELINLEEPEQLSSTIENGPSNKDTVLPQEENLVAMVENPIEKQDDEKVDKIKSVKDVLNFLVGKIDKRKNKIVYISKTEESDMEITAINLGLFKYRKEY
ncbi:hypothetical protein EIM50_23735 [Pseudoxanthomonas sp. SGD-10]|nr:hypothetical protein EIM50_23735 [Pseudoxanthomonas sp. SGD-10]